MLDYHCDESYSVYNGENLIKITGDELIREIKFDSDFSNLYVLTSKHLSIVSLSTFKSTKLLDCDCNCFSFDVSKNNETIILSNEKYCFVFHNLILSYALETSNLALLIRDDEILLSKYNESIEIYNSNTNEFISIFSDHQERTVFENYIVIITNSFLHVYSLISRELVFEINVKDVNNETCFDLFDIVNNKLIIVINNEIRIYDTISWQLLNYYNIDNGSDNSKIIKIQFSNDVTKFLILQQNGKLELYYINLSRSIIIREDCQDCNIDNYIFCKGDETNIYIYDLDGKLKVRSIETDDDIVYLNQRFINK